MDYVWGRFFFHFFRERSFKSRQNPRVEFFSDKKRLRRIQHVVFPSTVVEFCVDGLFTTPLYSPRRGHFVNSAFPNKKNLAQKRSYLWQTNLKANVCRNSTFQVNRRSRKNRELKNHDDNFVDDDRKWVTVYCASATSKFRRRGVVDDAKQSRITSSCNPQASAGINPLF